MQSLDIVTANKTCISQECSWACINEWAGGNVKRASFVHRLLQHIHIVVSSLEHTGKNSFVKIWVVALYKIWQVLKKYSYKGSIKIQKKQTKKIHNTEIMDFKPLWSNVIQESKGSLHF